jgi:hypothetical protein
MKIKIYQETKNSMQSGNKTKKYWFVKEIIEDKFINLPNKPSLQGWRSSDSMSDQIKIKFHNKEEAILYAKEKYPEINDYQYIIEEQKSPKIRKKSYQSNFTDPII